MAEAKMNKLFTKYESPLVFYKHKALQQISNRIVAI